MREKCQFQEVVEKVFRSGVGSQSETQVFFFLGL